MEQFSYARTHEDDFAGSRVLHIVLVSDHIRELILKIPLKSFFT